MHTLETFFKPGLEPAEDVLLELQQNPAPRTVRAGGVRFAILWRVVVYLVCIGICALMLYYGLDMFIEQGSLVSWFVIIALVPICLAFVPWWLISSYRRAVRSFSYCATIYRNGVPALGAVNILTRVTGADMDCHHIEHHWNSSRSKVRIDYTFCVDNVVKTGTAMLREYNMNYLTMNCEICVLYLPEDPTQNMIFPIPGSEFFEYMKK